MYKAIKADIDGKSKNEAFKFLFGKGLELPEVNKAWASFGSKSVKGGILANINKYLGESPRTEKDLAEFLLTETSPNAIRWFSTHNATRLLTIAIFAQFGKKVTEVAKTEAQVKRMEVLVKSVTKAK